MERILLFENKNLRLEYVPEGNYMHETWWGITNKAVFVELLEKILHFLEENRASGLLLDAREHKGLGPESQDLAAKKVGEYALSIGKLKEAIIVPKDVFSQFSVQNYLNKVKGHEYPVESMFFDNIEKAEAWLKENKAG